MMSKIHGRHAKIDAARSDRIPQKKAPRRLIFQSTDEMDWNKRVTRANSEIRRKIRMLAAMLLTNIEEKKRSIPRAIL
jgi:hypothetical protein